MIKLAVLGSTRGTTMQAIINAIKQGILEAEISIVISDKKDAYILERAARPVSYTHLTLPTTPYV